MASERRKYVMSVELAMQREISYRQKLESELLKQTRNAPLLHNEMSIPASSCAPRSTSEVSGSPTLSSWLKPSPRPPSQKPSPSSSPRSGPIPLQPQPTCSLPKHMLSPQRPFARSRLPSLSDQVGPRLVSILGPAPKPMPVHPSPHLNLPASRPKFSPQHRLLIRPILPSSPYPGPSEKRKEAPDHEQLQPDHASKMSKLICKVCNVICSSTANLQMHLEGQKHQSKVKLQGLEKKGENIVKIEAIGTRLHCELCGVWCMNEFSYKQHLCGKNHFLKLHAAEMKI